MKPPSTIDGAKIIEWAWSGSKPFGVVQYKDGQISREIYGLAICRYENSNIIYRFCCDKNWETQQDGDYPSIDDAKKFLPDQYSQVIPQWIIYDQNT